jgi:hypothetical protein
MKIVKGFCILVISVVLGSCFDPPEFPNVPQIEFQSIQFKRGLTLNDPDSLILTISFKDGDGDMGIDAANPQYISYPYNNLIFYRTGSNGELIPINTVAGIYNGDTLNVLDIIGSPGENLGELVYPRTRIENPLYADLPLYHCSEYEYLLSANLWLHQSAVSLLETDPSDQILDTINIPNYGTFYQLQDTIHIDVNPTHYNIDVDFLEYAPGTEGAAADGYREYDWRKQWCQSFDGRFPVLSDDDNALEGNIRYSMNSLGFRPIFGGKTVKLRVTVRDRQLHQSNVVETTPFTMQ